MDESKSNIHAGHRQRLRRRFAENGLENFADHEVLELILSYAIARKDTNPLAHRLLDAFGSLGAVLQADQEDLRKIPGLGEVSVSLLSLFAPVARRLLAEQNEEPRLPTSASAAKYIASLLFGRKTECLYLICLDASYRVLYKCIVMEGSIDFVPVSTREIVSIALRHNATRLILAHNHPSGSPLPSRQDILVTQKLVHALAQIDIQLSDHIIIAGREYYSFADKHSHVNPMLSRETNGAADNYLGVVYLPEENPAAHTE